MEENKNINEFDNLFKDAFNNAEVTPPADAWSAIQSQIGSAGAGATGAGGSSFMGGLTSIKGILIAAAVTTGIITTVVLTSNKDDKATTDTNKEVVAENNNTNNNPTSKTEDKTALSKESGADKVVDAETPASTNNTPNINGGNNAGGNITPNATNNTGDNVPSNTGNITPTVQDPQSTSVEVPEGQARLYQSTIKEVTVNKVQIRVLTEGQICSGSFVKFSTDKNSSIAAYSWDFGDGSDPVLGVNVSHYYSKPGKYTVKLTASGVWAKGVTDERVVVVGGTAASFVALDMGEGKFKFDNTSNGATTYKWFFGDDSENESDISPEHQYYSENPTNYKVTLIATSSDGCADTFENRLVNRYVINKEEPTAPNVFTPVTNNAYSNGVNDNFTVAIEGEDFYDLIIYNAEKQVVFKSNDKNKTWNGTDLSGNPCNQGTYYYILRYSYQGDDEVRQKSGTVAIIR